MPTDPRLTYSFDELDMHTSSFPADGTINLPVMNAGGYVPSTSLGLSVTLVNANNVGPQCGLGAGNAELLGKIKQVDMDGTVTVQDRGYMTLQGNGAAPAINAPVGVDGAGKVQSTAGNKQAFFCGVWTARNAQEAAGAVAGTVVWVVKKT